MRRKYVRLDPEVFVPLLKDGVIPSIEVKSGIPQDAKLISCGFDGPNVLYYTFEHESFPEIPEGVVTYPTVIQHHVLDKPE
jgi:hypothetical protein